MEIYDDIKGFTLVEALIAMLILSIGILSLSSMQVTGIKGNASSIAITEAANAARGKIEQFAGMDFTNNLFDVGVHNEPGVPPVNSIQWTVADWRSDGLDNNMDGHIDEFNERGVKSVQLTVQYTDKGVLKNSTVQFFKTEIF